MSDGTKTEEAITLVPPSDVTADRVIKLKEDIDKVIGGTNFLIVDLKEASVIDSSGIGVLISAQNQLLKNQGKLKVINATDDIVTMFKIMRLDKHFEIVGKI